MRKKICSHDSYIFPIESRNEYLLAQFPMGLVDACCHISIRPSTILISVKKNQGKGKDSITLKESTVYYSSSIREGRRAQINIFVRKQKNATWSTVTLW